MKLHVRPQSVSVQRKIRPGACIGCHSPGASIIYRSGSVPVQIGALWSSHRDAVSCPKGDVTLALCHQCGLIWNTTFDPVLVDYCQEYDNSLDFSPVFQGYAHALAQHLVDGHHLYGKRIVDIGCGKGQFLELLCELGDNSGVGYDPSHQPSSGEGSSSARVRILPCVYSGPNGEGPVDFVCCRQVLEHISTPNDFLVSLRQTLDKNRPTGIYFEVPNMMHTLGGRSIWTIIYEHVAYYCAAPLARLFRANGFQVRQITENYESQFLGLEGAAVGRVRAPDPVELSSVREIARRAAVFRRRVAQRHRSVHRILKHASSKRESVVVWGGGARAVSFLNTLEDPRLVHSVVDINPNKHGKFVAGTGHPIVPPESLRALRPQLVVIMNTIYRNEISGELDAMGLHPALICA